MDDDVNRPNDEIPEDAEQPIEKAGEQIEQAAENAWEEVEETAEAADEQASQAWDHVEEVAQDVREQVSQTTEQTWNHIEEAAEETAEQIGEAVVESWEQVEHGETIQQIAEDAWDRVEDVDSGPFEKIQPNAEIVQGVWSNSDNPATAPAGPEGHQHSYGDEYVPEDLGDCCEPDATIDPRASAEFMSSPVGLGPDSIGPSITAEDLREIKAEHYAATINDKVKDKKDFPAWAIILIILLVLCICVLLPVLLVFSGGFAIFRDLFSGLGGIVPYLFV